MRRLPLFLIAVLLLPGCVYLRLLDLRGQLADFDRYIEVVAGPGLGIRFREPPLDAEDVTTLIGSGPTATAPFPGGEARTYAFTRLPSDQGEDPPGAVTTLVMTTLVAEGRLQAVTFPPEVFRAVPRSLALSALRAMGRAEVDTARRSAEIPMDPLMDPASVPTGHELVEVFGHPNLRQPLPGGGSRWVWRYRLQRPEEGAPVMAAVAFVFAGGRERPVQFQVHISGMWLYLGLR